MGKSKNGFQNACQLWTDYHPKIRQYFDCSFSLNLTFHCLLYVFLFKGLPLTFVWTFALTSEHRETLKFHTWKIFGHIGQSRTNEEEKKIQNLWHKKRLTANHFHGLKQNLIDLISNKTIFWNFYLNLHEFSYKLKKLFHSIYFNSFCWTVMRHIHQHNY